MERRLAAIVAADMVGYSRLVELDETETLIRQKRHFAELIEPTYTRHNGHIIKTTGDGLIAEFPSVVDAVQCCVHIQKEMLAREEDVPEDRKIRYRIGINLGDVIFDDDDVFGDGVNIAARLEGLAEPGGIVVSGTAYDMLKANVEVGYEALGEQLVKNIATPIRVYKVVPEGETGPSAPPALRTQDRRNWRKPAAVVAAILAIVIAGAGWWLMQPDFEPVVQAEMAYPLPEKKSIVVLPFRNQTGDEDRKYIPDALTEAVIDALATEPKITLMSRKTSFGLDPKTGPAQAAEKLGVQFVLEGSVSGPMDRMKIRARLSDALSGKVVWSGSWDGRSSQDVFELLEKIADQVMLAMQVKLTVGEQARKWRKLYPTPELYRLSVKWRRAFQRFSPKGHKEAQKHWGKIMEAAPELAMAHHMGAYLHWQRIILSLSTDRTEDIRLARAYTERAIAIGPIGDFYTLAGTLDLLERKHEDAARNARRALELSPGGSEVAQLAGWILGQSGFVKEGIAHMERGMRLEPDLPGWTPNELSWLKLHAGDRDGARGISESVLRSDIATAFAKPLAHERLAAIAVWDGEMAKARGHIARLLELLPKANREGVLASSRRLFFDQAFVKKYADALVAAGLPEK